MAIRKIKPRKCPECGKEYTPFQSFQKTCISASCCLNFSKKAKIKKLEKERKIKNNKFDKEFYDNDVKTRKKAAKDSCHAYIRARDKGLPCICCNRSMATGKINAGHWLESGNYSSIRYHEDNIHNQLEYCNTYQHGDSDDYEGNLRKKIGNDRVDWLISQKNVTVKRTVQDYREIEQYYKLKLQELDQ